MSAPTSLYKDRRVVVCVGTGGVGKTTVAASLALAAAHEGRRVLVMTIDPSRRLAQALGIDLTANNASGTVAVEASAGRKGTLSAKVLDVQATFDALVRDRATSDAQAKEILGNRIYRHFSASMAGSHEYAAVEALWDAYNDPNIDLVILDTPPSQHAVDFLEAPERILHFLQGNQLVEKVPGAGVAKAWSKRLFDLGGSLVTRAVGKISGAETLQDVLSFLNALSDMYDSFRERAEGVGKLLCQPDVAFLLVGAPTTAQLAALGHFVGELTAHGISPNGFVLNRMHPDPRSGPAQAKAGPSTPPAAAPPPLQQALTEAATQAGLAAEETQALTQALDNEIAQAKRDQGYRAQLTRTVAPVPVWTLDEMAGDVDSRQALEGLADVLRVTETQAS